MSHNLRLEVAVRFVLIAIVLILVLTGAISFWLWTIYNRLIRLRNEVTNAWGQIETELERRLDLVPNLVSTVKGYAAHERETLEAVIDARARATSGGMRPDDALASQDVLTAALGRLLVVSERYPELKADSSFMRLQGELAQTENRISFGRKLYNEAAKNYNTAQQIFPANLVASRFHHKASETFKASDSAARAPKVEF